MENCELYHNTKFDLNQFRSDSIAEIFIIQKFMSVLSPDGMMVLLDDIKSRYPVVPVQKDRSTGAE